MTSIKLPYEWKFMVLGDFAEVKYGKARPKDSGSIPVIGSGGEYGLTSKPLIDYSTIVIGRKGTAGLAWLQSQPCWPSDTTFYLQWKNRLIDHNYLFYHLQGKPLSGEHAKTTLPSVLKQDLEKYPLIVPPLPEQRAIARALRAVQGAREARLREMALERERKAALMDRLFTKGIRGEATKMTEIGEMPESWQVVKLGEVVASTQYGLSVCGNSEGNYPILRMNCLVEGRVNDSNLQFVDLTKSNFENFRLNKGDILFNRTNSSDLVGKTGLFNLDGDFVFASYLIRIAVDKNHLYTEFINYYINMNSTQTRLRMLASRGVSQSNINATKLKGFLIPLPQFTEQQAIARILKACDSKIAALDHEARLLQELFRAMLEELMSARLPAGALVEPEG